jgi:hypothetical protein
VALRDRKKIHAVRVAIARQLTVINASPFRYRTSLGRSSQPVRQRHAVAPRRLVAFLTEEEHASLLTLVWRFGAPVVLLLAPRSFDAVALERTFGPLTAPLDKSRRSLAEQIRAPGSSRCASAAAALPRWCALC